MKIKLPGKAILLIGLILACAFALSAADRQVNLSSSGNQARLLNNSDLGFDVQFRVGDLKIMEVQTKKGTFDELSIDGWGFSNDVGEPKLPMLRRTIAVPLGAEVRFQLNSQSTRELDSKASKLQNRVIPAQEPISKSADPATLPFVVNERLYSRDEFNSRDWVQVTELGMMRGVRVFALDFYPVRYNPVTNSIRVMEKLDVRVDFVNPDLIATADMLARTASWEFEQLYSNTIFNWNADNRTALVRHPTKMVILCPVGYTSNIQSYVDWKTQQGFVVNVATVGSGGTVANTTTAIKNYMQSLWDAATADDPAPTYLLIIGDESGTITVATNTGATGSHVTDLNYVRLNGTDYMPEMYHGRFSVSSTTELANIVSKTITFEKTQMPDISYLGKTVLIAGVDSSWSPTHANGAINYATTEYFNAAHGITSDTYLYPASGSSAAQIRANANEGRGYIVYTAHGSQTSWHDPSFTVSDVNAMTNSGKYGVMVGNCCITNEFDYSSPCFGEAVIRKADGGGVAYIGGINSTYWYEDYYWAVGYKTNINGSAPAYDATKLGAYDAMFHTHGETYDKWATTVGEGIYSGNLAVQQSGSSRTNYYWEIYHIMGDPSLMPYLGVPTANPASYPTQIMVGNTSYAITGAAPYTRVGLTMNGVIYGSGITDASGNLTLTITPFTSVGTAKLVLTAQNRITKIADIAVIAAQGPFMSVDQVAYDDANNDVPEYNESGYFDVTFKNVGVDPASNVSAILSCSTSGITITDNSHSISSLAAGATVLANNAYAITIANNVPDGTVANFTITMTMSGHNPWTHNFTLTLNAPALTFGNMTISDPTGNNNGRLDPGETVTITMPLNNNGGAASPNGTATMSCTTPGITVNNGNASFSAISAGGVSNLTFSLTANASMDIGTVVSLNFAATAGQYSASKTENTPVGLIIEDFSTGDFSSFPWIMGGTLPWTIDSSTYYSAGYSARSGAISHSQTSTMETTRVLSAPGELSFWYKVSSESNYDKLRFYVDGTQQNEWSGNIDWTQATYTLAAGTRVLKWEYVKDYSVSSGSDCAWVDDIIFPASTTPSSFYPPRNLTAAPGNGYVTLNWDSPVYGTPTGYRIYRDGSLLTTVTGLTYTDNAVVNETTYSYYLVAVYSGGVSDPSNTVQATPSAIVPTEVIIGTGTDSNSTSIACPINVWYQSLHGQSVYTAAELNAAGVVGPINITQIGFNVTGLPALAMPNFVVRMGHTSATDVSSWISTGLTQVWSSSSYQPTNTGWNMYTLSTPFLWNGIDNIVVDTAFGLIGSYSSSGTTQYTSVTNGYRYVRSDNSDQTNIFSGGYNSSYRPNLKLTLQPNQSGPVILVNPTTLAYGDVAVGSTDTKTFTIQNSGDQTLTGTITTPAGYTVAAARNSTEAPLAGKESRNSLSFSINAGATKTYNLTFAPTAVASYNGNVVIANNSINNTSVNIAVTGTGYNPPTIDIDNDALYAYLQVGTEGTDSFTITNTGSQPLTFSISMTELPSRAGNLLQAASAQEKSIAGSTLTLDASSYLPGTTVDWTFTATNASTDVEWLRDVIISFPAGVTVNSATNFVGGSGGDMTPDVTSGNGVTITWHGETSYGYGVIKGGESASATVNVTIGASFGGNLTLPWTLNGDIYGSEPHTLSGSNVLTQDSPPIPWLSVQPLSGNIAAGQSQTITANFSAIGMAVGTYEAMLTIHSNDPVNPTLDVSATMDVWDTGNHAPTINLPASFAFDRNGSLTVNFNSYVSDEDGDPLTLGYSGNTNVFVAINGLNVTFTAAQNWTGSETITFSVYDGQSYAYDSVVVTVNEVAGPGWTPVIYTNSATIHGIVTIYGVAAELNDVVGAFVGSECRGVADVVTNGGNAYVTLV
ncbi:MAG TPA: C25 family cysteine peptidase, partial [Candidatus Cloacimonadota bacterium]|nr:C25 family cysteine peptidase [Candidatus Cloacimonadota bacterium]